MKSLDYIKNKILSKKDLNSVLSRLRFKDEKIVFTNGCFDILHQGHVDYLSKAADLGTKLIVAVNSDDSVKRLGKGESRPLQDESSRALLIASLQFVDYVLIFDEDTPLEIIDLIRPNVLAKGSDYEIEQIVGHKIVLGNGGEVKRIDFLEGYSTTSIVNKVKAE